MKKNALIIGIRNQDSICYYIAKELIKNGYDIYATYQKETENSVKEIAKDIGIKKFIFMMQDILKVLIILQTK